MPTIQELQERKLKTVEEARAIDRKATDEKRRMTKDEEANFDKAMKDVDALTEEIRGLERDEQRKSRLNELETELRSSRGRKIDPPEPGGNGGGGGGDSPSRRGVRSSRFAQDGQSFELEVRGHRFQVEAGTPIHRRNTQRYIEAYRSWLSGAETRALQTDLDTAGGFLTTPEQFFNELLMDVDDQVFIRKYARKFTVKPDVQSIGIPRRTSKMAAASWGEELSTPKQDVALKFGKRSLTPHYMTTEILVSRDLIRSSVMDPETIVVKELTRDMGELEEKAFISGTGYKQPLGIFTASSDGISTARDVSSGNTTTGITFDGLISAKFALKQKYRATAEWLLHRDAVSQIRKLKDSYGQYLWQPGTQAGEPDRILNLAYTESEWVPNTFTTGQYVGALVSWDYYWIVDSLYMDMQRLLEKYAEFNQVAFIARRKVDGAPTIEEAFARIKLA